MLAHNVGFLALNDILSNTPIDKQQDFYTFNINIINQLYRYEFTHSHEKWIINYYKVDYEK